MSNLGVLMGHFGMLHDQEVLYLESIEIRKRLGDLEGLSSSLGNLGGAYKRQGKFDEAESIQMAALQLRRRLGHKRGISLSLLNLGEVYEGQGRIEEAERSYLNALEIDLQLGDKKSIGGALNNLGVVLLLQGKQPEALERFKEAIALQRELKEKGTLLATVHRAFTLFEGPEREALLAEMLTMETTDFTVREYTWLLSMELMNACLNKTEIEAHRVLEMCNRIQSQTEQLALTDLDDLPVETFYVASRWLNELQDTGGAGRVAKQALVWIGNQPAIRKTELRHWADQCPAE